MKLCTIALTVLLAIPFPASGDDDVTAIVDRYLAAIQAQDWPAMRALLAADAHYLDYSMEHLSLPIKDLRGAEAIVGFWRDSSNDSGTVSIRFDLGERFVAGPNLVLRGG